MPDTRHVTTRKGDILLLVGTMKGAFILRANKKRGKWDVGGPYFPGSAVYALAFDARAGRQRLWAGPNSMHWGGLLRSSDDFGRTWTNPVEANVKFPAGTNAALKQIWQIVPGRDADPDVLYCGVEPAALFQSRDAGETWSLVDGLWNHPQRERWQPGGGGLCLHTILLDPEWKDRIRVAISTGGMYVTDDGGATWRPSNRGVRAEFLPDKYPEFGQCVHKVVQSRQKPERMFLQNHWGLYRSDDRGESWTDIANKVPSDFGFAMGIHPEDPDTAWIVPLESDQFRCTPEGKLRVYRTRDAGKKWEAMTKGLPQEEAFETVLRDAMAVDALDPAGVYFGTRSGKLFASDDQGKSWKKVLDGLPPILAVKTAIVPPPSRKRKGA
ncbi:MAG: WD40/YVTN/BNR-like repeat-containing protein [Thermoanaerobaculia bacterium]